MKALLIAVAAVALAAPLVTAFSSPFNGYPYRCDVFSTTYGCPQAQRCQSTCYHNATHQSTYNNPYRCADYPNFVQQDRLNCCNNTNYMNWANNAVWSNRFTMTIGDGNTSMASYVPNTVVNIHIRSLMHMFWWRGIMIYARVNGSSYINHGTQLYNNVGLWMLPDEAQPTFYRQDAPDALHPFQCPGSLFQYSGKEKYADVVLQFRFPPAGTGSIVFEALLKQGPANTGFFYWPMTPELTSRFPILTEATPVAPSPVRWTRSDLGQSCTQKCALHMSTCMSDQLMVNSAAGLDVVSANSDGEIACQRPYLASWCNLGGVAPTSGDGDGLCYYYSNASAQQCGVSGLGDVPTCDAQTSDPTYGRRLCPCAAATFQTLATTTTTPLTTTTTGNNGGGNNDGTPNGNNGNGNGNSNDQMMGEGNSGSSTSSYGNIPLIVGIIIGVLAIAVILAVVLALRRRKMLVAQAQRMNLPRPRASSMGRNSARGQNSRRASMSANRLSQSQMPPVNGAATTYVGRPGTGQHGTYA